jgi:hypothetical protein
MHLLCDREPSVCFSGDIHAVGNTVLKNSADCPSGVCIYPLPFKKKKFLLDKLLPWMLNTQRIPDCVTKEDCVTVFFTFHFVRKTYLVPRFLL